MPRSGQVAGRSALIRSAPLVAAVAAAVAVAVSCSAPSPAERWWAHVRWLSDDARQGRGTGSAGYRAAAEYTAREFERAGARPAGLDGYFQPVRFVGRRIREPECLLALVREGRADTLALGEDAVFSMGFDAPESLEAEAVFVGHGISVPDHGHDDLKGVDLRGKIAVFLKGGPESIPANRRAHAQHSAERWRHLKAAGAIGWAYIPDPEAMQVPWERGVLNRFDWNYELADTALDEQHGRRFGITVNPARAERLFEGTGRAFREIVAAAHRGEPLPRFPLAQRIRARVRFERTEVESPNVVGVIEGGDPALRGESVVLSAHLDHLGIGAPVRGDSIYNGAIDNASGVATLIEIARALRESGTPPRRSVVLLALTGEEHGLLGSRAFAQRTPPGVGTMVANLNLDMFLPIQPLRSLIVYGEGESTLGTAVRALADSMSIRIAPDPIPAQTIFIRSDQYNFIRRGIPALFPVIGPTGDSAIDARTRLWYRNRYHSPSDDAAQHVDRRAAAEFNRMLLRLARNVADATERPSWNAQSFFRSFASGEAARGSAPRGGAVEGRR